MALIIDHAKVTPENAAQLVSLCPFGAITYDGALNIGAGCRMCRLCIRKGPEGVITFREE